MKSEVESVLLPFILQKESLMLVVSVPRPFSAHTDGTNQRFPHTSHTCLYRNVTNRHKAATLLSPTPHFSHRGALSVYVQLSLPSFCF